MNLNKLFQNYCKKNNLEINPNQLDLIEELNLFYNHIRLFRYVLKLVKKGNIYNLLIYQVYKKKLKQRQWAK